MYTCIMFYASMYNRLTLTRHYHKNNMLRYRTLPTFYAAVFQYYQINFPSNTLNYSTHTRLRKTHSILIKRHVLYTLYPKFLHT